MNRNRRSHASGNSVAAPGNCSCVALTSDIPVGRRRDSNSYIPIVVLLRYSRLLLLAQLYLLLPWSRTFPRLTTREGGNAKGLLGTILALSVAYTSGER